MERHQRRLADAEQEHRIEHREQRRTAVAGQNPAVAELRGPGQQIGPDDGRQQQADRGRQQNREIDTRSALRILIALVGDQRPGGQGHELVAHEQRHEIAGKGNPLRRGDRQRETQEEPGLVLLRVAAHIADGIQRGQRPKHGGDSREQQPQRLHPELEGETRQPVPYRETQLRIGRTPQGADHQGQHQAHQHRTAIAQIGAAPQQQHQRARQQREQHRQRQGQRLARACQRSRQRDHGAAPSRAADAVCARASGRRVSIPK